MSQAELKLKTETVAEIIQLESGRIIIRVLPGKRLSLTGFASTAAQAPGVYELRPLAKEIEMSEAMDILGVPYTTLRRIIEMEAVKASKRSPGRWVLDLQSVLTHKAKAESDPEYWDNLKPLESALQQDLRLG